MKICQINIFGTEGSTGSIVSAIDRALLEKGHESFVFYGLGQSPHKTNYTKIAFDSLCLWYGRFCKILGLRFTCAYFETLYLIIKLWRISPEIVHIHLVNSFYVNPFLLFKYLAYKKIKVVVTNHADIHFTANCDCAFDCIKWETGCHHCDVDKVDWGAKFFNFTHLSWKIFFNLFRCVDNLYLTSVSPFTHNRALKSRFFENIKDSRVILNGVDTSYFYRISELEKKDVLSSDYDRFEKVVLHVTPNMIDPNKGFKYVVEMATSLPNILFIVVGEQLRQDIDMDNILFWGRVSDKYKLSQLYNIANLTLLSSRQESFSLVCAESLCCGTPVVGFKAGGPESIALTDYCYFVNYGDINELSRTIKSALSRLYNKELISKEAKAKFSILNMQEEYLEFYSSICNEVSTKNKH